MKKLLLITSVITALTTTSSNAYTKSSAQGRPYAGLDLTFVNVDHKNNASDNDGVGFGLSLGYKIPSDKLFIAPEIFYDYLDTSVVYRLGAKVNIGYEFTPKVSGFVNLGVANSGYDDTSPSSRSSYSSSANKMSMIYGVGIAYNLNHDWAVRASYDIQKFNVRYVNTSTDRLSLGVFKIGAMYNF